MKYMLTFILIQLGTIISYGQTIERIGTGLDDLNASSRFDTKLVKLDSLIFLAGEFEGVDGTPCNNVAILHDGVFTAAGAGISPRVEELFLFQGKVVAWNGEHFYWWQDEEWVQDSVSFEGRVEGVAMLNERLYVYGSDLKVNDILEESDILYNDGLEWKRQPINWSTFSWGIGHLAYLNGSLVGASPFNGGLIAIDSVGNMTEIAEEIRLESLQVIDDQVFATSQDGIYVLDGEQWRQVLVTDERNSRLFKIKHRTYLGTINSGTYLYGADRKFKRLSSRAVGILHAAEIDEQTYLVTGRLGWLDFDTTSLNNIALLKFETPKASLELSRDTICENEYVELYAIQFDLYMEYDWTLDGATPKSSVQASPAIKYTEAGAYEVILDYSNVTEVGPTQVQSIVVLPGCKLEQQEQYDNVWPMGQASTAHAHAAGIDFSNGEPIQGAFNNPFGYTAATSAISNSSGQLQFSSNGKLLVSVEGVMILNSDGFNLGDSSVLNYNTFGTLPQLLTVLPSAINSDLYYILHTPLDFSTQPFARVHNQLQMSVVDMSLNEGKGEMTIKNLPIIEDRLQQSFLQASRHCNGVDWWIVAGKYDSDLYYSILLTAEGETIVTEQSLGVGLLGDHQGQSTFSPDGSKFALSSVEDESIYIWDFNNCTGELSNYKTLQPADLIPDRFCRGVGFSPNSRFLYAGGSNRLYQYDMCREDINASAFILAADEESQISYSRIASGPNGKMYVSQFFSGDSLSTIHNPDLPAAACDFRRLDLAVSKYSVSRSTLPHMPHYRTASDTVDCQIVLNTDRYSWAENCYSIFPSPVSDMATLTQLGDLCTAQELEVEIWNAQGKLVQHDTWYTRQDKMLNINQLANGSYFVRLIADHSITVKKLIVQKH